MISKLKKYLKSVLWYLADLLFSDVNYIITIVGFCLLVIYAAGFTYKSVRLATEYKIKQGRVAYCDSTFVKGGYEIGDYFTYKLVIEGVKDTITKISKTKFSFHAKPKCNWCELKGDTINIYYSDKLNEITILRPGTKKSGTFQLIRAKGSGFAGNSYIITIILVIVALVLGIIFYINSVKSIFKKVKPNVNDKNKINISIRYFNSMVLPSISVILAFLLVFFIGIGFALSLFYLEHLNYLIIGLLFTISIAFATFGPGLFFRTIYLLKTSDNQFLSLFKNLLIIAALIKLTINFIEFFTNHPIRELNMNSVNEIIIQVFGALF